MSHKRTSKKATGQAVLLMVMEGHKQAKMLLQFVKKDLAVTLIFD